MPASPYFLLAQVSLVAVSAVAMKVGWSTQSPVIKPTKAASTQVAAQKKELPTTSSVPKALPFSPNKNVADKLPLASSEPPTPALADKASAAIPSRTLGSSISSSDTSQAPRIGMEVSSAPPEAPPEPPLSDIPTAMAAYNIEADAATQMDLKTQTVVFTGSVHLKSKRFALVADRLTVYMDPAQSTLKKLVANGHVDVQITAARPEEAYRGTSHEATYNPKDFSIILTGWPTIIGAGREHRAAAASTQMTLYTEKPRLTTQGRASTLITGTSEAKKQSKAAK